LIEEKLKSIIRDIPDFPKPGITFKDITPLFQNPALSKEIIHYLSEKYEGSGVSAVLGVESRGFFFGFALAQELGLPFIPVRKPGKLPYETISHDYELEYGTSSIEIHVDTIKPGDNVLIHDDLLATGGTALAAAELVKKLKGKVSAFSFLVELGFLNGRERINGHSGEVHSIAIY